MNLAIQLQGTLRFDKVATVLEEVVRLDSKASFAYNFLAYAYALGGELPRALEAVDKYAALLPPGDPNPMDTRGDVLSYAGRFDDALAQYRKNVELNPTFLYTPIKIGLVYLVQGKYSLAEASVTAIYEKGVPRDKALAAGVLGNIEVGRGRLDRAVARFEDSARRFGAVSPEWARSPLLKAAQVYLEQGQPKAALALGKRFSGPGAADVRAIAYLVMKNENAAEKEFSSVRATDTPLFGEYAAARQVDFDRLLARVWTGQWQEVIAAWPRLPLRSQASASWAVGRACAETGALQDAERHFQTVALQHRDWGNGRIINQHSFLSYALSEFYLGKVYERQGKKAEAVNAYQEFLNHFENSTARLPQIPEARAALKRLL